MHNLKFQTYLVDNYMHNSNFETYIQYYYMHNSNLQANGFLMHLEMRLTNNHCTLSSTTHWIFGNTYRGLIHHMFHIFRQIWKRKPCSFQIFLKGYLLENATFNSEILNVYSDLPYNPDNFSNVCYILFFNLCQTFSQIFYIILLITLSNLN